MEKAVLSPSASASSTCQYPLARSSVENQLAPESASMESVIDSWKGVCILPGDTVQTPEVDALSGMLPSVASAASPTVGGSGVSPSTTMTGVPPSTLNLSNLFPTLFGSLPFTVTQSINSSSINAAVSQSQTLTLHPNVAPDNITNSNPFFIRFIAGNIQMCQGCRSGIPQPPFDLAIARFERRSYR